VHITGDSCSFGIEMIVTRVISQTELSSVHCLREASMANSQNSCICSSPLLL